MVMKINVKKRFLRIFFDLCFIFSFPFLTLLFSGKLSDHLMICLLILSFLTGIFVKVKILNNNIYKDIDLKLIVLLSIYTLYNIYLILPYSGGLLFIKNFILDYLHLEITYKLIAVMIAIMSFYSFLILLYYLFPKIWYFIHEEYLKLSKGEKKFLLVSFLGAFCLTLLIYSNTNIFYKPISNNRLVNYNVIFTSDSGAISAQNAFMNIGMSENDLRQPLFGIFAMPFAVLANFLSLFLFFIPNGYYIIFNTLQILLIVISFILIAKMMKINSSDKKYFGVLVFSSFPVMLFSFLCEQYVFAFFYLVLFIYVSQFTKYYDVNYSYISATGCLLTTGILFPFIAKFKNIKDWIYKIFKCFIAFMIILVLTGQIMEFLEAFDQFNRFSQYSGQELLFIDKFLQYLSFVRSSFFAPAIEFQNVANVYSIQLKNVNSVDIIGLTILVICLISFILNYRNKFAVISFGWICYSFILLCVIGWGAQENGLILYSLYFSWAFLVLIYLFILNMFKSRKIKRCLISLFVLIMFIVNLNTFYEIIKFGMQYYFN